jgi:hypothetical protein
VDPAVAEPAVDPAVAEPAVDPAVAEPAVDPAVAEPTVETPPRLIAAQIWSVRSLTWTPGCWAAVPRGDSHDAVTGGSRQPP